MNPTIQVRMYSFDPLPNELRTTFEIPEWPYLTGNMEEDPPQATVDYFNKYTIVRYEDEIRSHKYALILPLPDGRNPVGLKEHWKGYSHHCVIDTSVFRVASWSKGDNPEFLRDQRERFGDLKAWLEFNHPVNIRQMDYVKVATY